MQFQSACPYAIWRDHKWYCKRTGKLAEKIEAFDLAYCVLTTKHRQCPNYPVLDRIVFDKDYGKSLDEIVGMERKCDRCQKGYFRPFSRVKLNGSLIGNKSYIYYKSYRCDKCGWHYHEYKSEEDE